ncbi:hypothetical protein D9758_006031 [Tetrapyrgos nigripes]|uniref:Protein BFR2 n=1 Tax=Tetrapyrgos nigripes TaxID=182062 RepID=A0A8H5D8R5_9AGAR|nr:hypothetical protein D9758_006031 [Tetrapyrgos nigripes]
MSTSRLSLAQQIAQLDTPAPAEVDTEGFFPNIQYAKDGNLGREHYLDVGPSKLRNDSLSDPKYDGVKISRKQLMESDDMGSESVEEDEVGEDESGNEEKFAEVGNDIDDAEIPSDNAEDDENGDEDVQSEEEESEEDVEEDVEEQHSSRKEADEMTSALRRKQDDDKQKGIAVSRQLTTWDSLLDARIRLQKSISSANALPSTLDFADSPEYQQSLSKMLAEAALLSEELINLQETLLNVNETIDIPPRKKRRLEAESKVSDYEAYLKEASQVRSSIDHAYHPHLVQTLSKWSSKIQAVAPSVLLPSNRNAFSKDRSALKSAVQLVDETLEGHDKLLSRTRIWRGANSRLRAPSAEDDENKEDVEIFDDTDFYQQLLRDVIDAKEASGGDDWMVIQKQKKAKKKVDTKASKGRKLRYEVHEKLQHFMAPVAVRGAWHEEQIDELFASLLGKGFEHAAVEDITENGVSEMLGGFRVF